MNIAAHDQISTFKKQADIELVVVLKESYAPI